MCLLLSSWQSLLPVLSMWMAREDLLGAQCFPALVVWVPPACAAGVPTNIPCGNPRMMQLRNKSNDLNVFHCCSVWLSGPFQAATRKGFFFPPSLLSIHTGEGKSQKCIPADAGAIPGAQGAWLMDGRAPGWAAQQEAGGGRSWSWLEKMLGNFIPCHFRHGSVTVLMIFSHALISVLLSFTPPLFHH